MAAEKPSDQPRGPQREQAKDLTSPSPQPGPPTLNGGLETPRSNHC
jgi:hypothetical protein